MGRKLTGKALANFEAQRDVWQEVLISVLKIKAGGVKRTKVGTKSDVVPACFLVKLYSGPTVIHNRTAKGQTGYPATHLGNQKATLTETIKRVTECSPH